MCSLMTRKQPGRPAYPDSLTPAEWRVVDGVRHGLTNRAIAKRLGVSDDAVKFHVSNVLAKLGFSGRGELRQWTGVAAASALASLAPCGASEFGPIGQISRSVSDLESSLVWYRDVLGLPLLYRFDSLAFFDCGGLRLMLVVDSEAGPQSILYFSVTDVRTTYDALIAKGVRSVAAPHMIHRHADGTEEWMAFFADLEGRPLAIMAKSQSAEGELKS